MSAGVGKKALDELGLTSLIASPIDVKLLCLQRFVRLFAFGVAALILALHLEQLGYSDKLIGLFMALTMLGDVVISFVLTLFADKIGRKNVLVIGSALVCLSGVVFATQDAYWSLLTAAILGVVSPSGNEIGPFRAIEESIVSTLAPPHINNSRSDLFAWYTLIGTLGQAFGTLSGGTIVHYLMRDHGYTVLESYRALFWLYGCLGLVKLFFAACLSKRIELDRDKGKEKLPVAPPGLTAHEDDERRPLLDRHHQSKSSTMTLGPSERTLDGAPLATYPDSSSAETTPLPKRRTLLPQVSAESRQHLTKLVPLFAIDSFASGLIPLSWLSPFFHEKFGLSHEWLGTLFFAATFIAAASNIVSASFARRVGLVYTMVFAHLTSDVFLALIPLPGPKLVWLAVTFLALRSATSTMDTAPRQAFLAALLVPAERTAVMGSVNVVRTISQAVGPLASGVLKGEGMLWVSFLLAAGLKVCYDLGMLAAFWDKRNLVPDRKREGEDEDDNGGGDRGVKGGMADDEELGRKDGTDNAGKIQMADDGQSGETNAGHSGSSASAS